MINLAIQSAESKESFAILKDGKVLSERFLEGRERTSDILGTEIETELKNQKLSAKDVKLLTVVTGPGSFTGLKVGVAYAQGFSYGRNIPVVGITAFEVLARQVDVDGTVISLIFARNLRAYCQIYNKVGETLTPTSEPQINSIESLLAKVPKDSTIVGSAVIEYKAELSKMGFKSFSSDNQILASTSGKIGFERQSEGVDAFEIKPFYIAEPGVTIKKDQK